MRNNSITINYKVLDDIAELPEQLQRLLSHAHEAVEDAYAPYSKFKVGAAVLLENGILVKGSNQENASSPVGICAERVTLSAASATHPTIAIMAIAITAKANGYVLNEAVAPCGICRQTLLEYEERFQKPIQLILQGETGGILWMESSKDLLPLSFGKDDLKSADSITGI